MKDPLLIIGCGLAGTGKSEFLKKLASKYDNLVYLDKDTINNAFLLDRDFNPKRSYDFYKEHVKLQTYKAMFEIAKDNLLLDKSVILDGYFINKLKTPLFDKLLNTLSDIPYKLKLIYFYCDKETLWERLKERKYWRDLDKLEDKVSFDNYYEKDIEYTNNLKFDLKINTEKDINIVLKESDKFLST